MFRRLVKRRWLLALVVILLVGGGSALAWWQYGRGTVTTRATPEGPVYPLPAWSATPFLNTGRNARYIGAAACTACHADRHRSYLNTAHSQAMASVEPTREPPDGSFEHKASDRTYRVYRRDNLMIHEETLRDANGLEMARIEAPVRYRVGSGNSGRTYLVEIDGFLHESPITWYAHKQRWDMSPGYDVPEHAGFERAIGTGCLRCHAGQAEAISDTLHRVVFHEYAIGCESCHGPGSLHQQRHLRHKREPPSGADDLTIVNPGKLDRPLQEAICAACHLNDVASIPLRGREHTDYRPGLPLTDCRVDYELKSDDSQMTVVGHVQQLRRSACYQKSAGLTCLTCHNPHAAARPKDPVAFHRQQCLSCHKVTACGLAPDARVKQDAADNCVACHMPRGPTEIAHTAFTHHRIGRHSIQPAASATAVPEVVPVYDVSHLPRLDQERNLGLAYLRAAQSEGSTRFASTFLARAQKLLDSVHAQGLHDPESLAALIDLYTDVDRDRARTYLDELMRSKELPAEIRVSALQRRAHFAIQDGNYASAISNLGEAVTLRRTAEDWHMLGLAHLSNGQPREALSAFHQALAIRPYRPRIHFAIANAYRELRDMPHADEHVEKGRWLAKRKQD
jgi:Flp pilus assembly protein TadD